MFAKCLPIDDPDNFWKYCPSVPAAFILFVLFACSTIFHIYQAIKSFIVQIGGGLMSLSKTIKTANNGLHIYTGGVIFQQCLIVCFLLLTIKFQSKLRSNGGGRSTRRGALKLVQVLCTSLALITFRIIFRIVEFSFSQGTSVNTYINHHEFFVYIFVGITCIIMQTRARNRRVDIDAIQTLAGKG